MAQFLAHVLVLAALYCLVGIGFPLIYRASRILNLAQGELMMFGGYLLLLFMPLVGRAPWAGIILAVAAAVLFGMLFYWVMLRPAIGQPPLAGVVLTIALSIILRGAAELVWGPAHRNLSLVLGVPNKPHQFAGVSLSTFDLATLGAAVVVLAALVAFLRATRMGIQVRAAGENSLLAAQRGINIYLVFVLVWCIAAACAAIAGILYGANNRLDPDIGFVGLKALAVPLVGGIDSISGVIPAALLVAAAESAVGRYLDPRFTEVVPMLIMLFVLLLRPWGLFGTKEELERV